MEVLKWRRLASTTAVIASHPASAQNSVKLHPFSYGEFYDSLPGSSSYESDFWESNGLLGKKSANTNNSFVFILAQQEFDEQDTEPPSRPSRLGLGVRAYVVEFGTLRELVSLCFKGSDW
ncbi:hypothetical protein RhiJN_17124 [Ceratobasidium sp. AG-Ba]|nr:hypothetical protein RhiJN_17124 [Ceratobasidium sp. AG-Ba]